jgi:fibronectin-binding autotransporter adhesin
MALGFTIPTNGAGSNDANGTSWATGTIDFVAGRWYTIGVLIGHATATPDTTPTVSGATSGTWAAVSGVGFNTVGTNRSRLSTRRFLATTSFSEALTISTDTSGTHNGASWIVVETTDAWQSVPFVQNGTNRGDAGTAASFTYLSAFSHALNGALAFVAVDITGDPVSAGGSFTLLGQSSGTLPDRAIAAIAYVGDEDPSASFASADWAITAHEIAAALLATGSAMALAPAMDGAGTVAAGSGVTGSGDLAVAPALAASGAVTLAGSGDLAVQPAHAAQGAVTLAGAGDLTLPLALAGQGAAAAAGSGALTVALTLAAQGATAAIGAGDLTIAPALAGTGAVPAAGGSGTGDLALTVALAGSGTVAVSGTGDLAVVAVLAGSGAVTVSGAGDLAVTVAPGASGTLLYTASGDLAVALVPAGTGLLSLAGTGDLLLAPVLGGDGAALNPAVGTGALTLALTLAGTGAREATASAGGKYAPEHAGARAALGDATGFAAEHAGATAALAAATGFAGEHRSALANLGAAGV